MKSKRVLCYSLLCLLLLSGCGGGKITRHYAQDKVLLDQVNAYALGDSAWFDRSTLFGAKSLEDKYHGTVPAQVALYLEQGHYFIDDKPTIGHIHSIIETLLSGWKGPKTDVLVLIESNPVFIAKVDSYGQIILSTKFLETIKNDDELAAVLAHELSHVLLKHNLEKDNYNSMLWKIEDAAKFAEIAVISKDKGKSKRGSIVYADSAAVIWADILSPAWSREYERQADRLGLDLFIKAGYNSDSFFSMLMKLQEVNANQGKRLNKLAEMGKRHATQGLESDSTQTVKNKKWDKVLAGVGKSILIDSAHNWLAKRNVDYDTPAERDDAIKIYYRDVYKESFDIVSIKKVAIDKINTGSWKQNGGIGQLTISRVRNTELVPASTYNQMAEQYLKSNRVDQAVKILSLGIQRIGRDHEFLPSLIKIQKVQNNTQLAEEYTVKCLGKNANVIGSLIDVVTLQSSAFNQTNQHYYKKCVAILGYDPIAIHQSENTENNSRGTQKPLDSAIQDLIHAF